MKSVTLLKQRMLYKKEEEPADFVQEKREALEMKEHLSKAAGFLKAWLEGARAMQKASKDMSEVLAGEDADLDAISRAVSDGLADTQHGAGVVEVALDSVNRKIGFLNELKKKGETLETAHLELSRANRKLSEVKDPTKQASYAAEQERCQANYDRLRAELDASFKFILDEARASSPTGKPHPLGLLHQELSAFKASQVVFYRACNDVTSRFHPTEPVNVANVWTEFQDRRLAAIDAAMSNRSPSRAQSGRDLFRQGLSGGNLAGASQRQMSTRGAPPPPPPPPPPAAVVNGYQAMYEYTAAGADELSFQAGSTVRVLDQSDANWWMAEDELGNRGLVPSNYLAKV